MEVKNWTLVTFIVLVICTWHTESVSRLDWLDSDKKSARPEEVVASSIDDDSEEFDTRFDRFGREIRIPRAKNGKSNQMTAATANGAKPSTTASPPTTSKVSNNRIGSTTKQGGLNSGVPTEPLNPSSRKAKSEAPSTTISSPKKTTTNKPNVASNPSTTINDPIANPNSKNTTASIKVITTKVTATTEKKSLTKSAKPATESAKLTTTKTTPAPTPSTGPVTESTEMQTSSSAAAKSIPPSSSTKPSSTSASTIQTTLIPNVTPSIQSSSSLLITTEPSAPAPLPVTRPSPEPIVPGAQNKLGSFTCENLPKEYKGCSDICEDMRQNGEVTDEEGKMDTLAIIFFALFGVTVVVNLGVFFYFTCKTKRIPTIPPKPPADDAAAKLRAAYQNAPDPRDKVPVKKEDEGIDEPGPPSVKDTAAIIKMRAKLLETQANLQKLRAHVKKTTKQHKSDTRSGKFQKKGPIFIPMEPPIPPAAVLPDGIVLDNVTYNPKDNEMWEIGSDVDDIELDESFRLNTDSTTETEEEASQKSGSKKSKASKKQEGTDAKSKKTITEESKATNVIETPAPPTTTPTVPAPTASAAPTAPVTPTTPAPEPPKDEGKGADGKDKKDNKAGGNPSNKKN